MGWEKKILCTSPLATVPGSSGSFFSAFAFKALFAQSRVQPQFMPQSFGKPKP